MQFCAIDYYAGIHANLILALCVFVIHKSVYLPNCRALLMTVYLPNYSASQMSVYLPNCSAFNKHTLQ